MNTTKNLSIELATKMYNGNDELLKAFALENYPELGKDIIERVKTFEDACIILGIEPDSEFFTSEVLQPNEKAKRKIETIIKALNENWLPNWDDSNERKYYPWFNMSSSGSGFSCNVYGYVYSVSSVGSRLVLKTKDLAVYAAKQFTEIYKEMFTL